MCDAPCVCVSCVTQCMPCAMHGTMQSTVAVHRHAPCAMTQLDLAVLQCGPGGVRYVKHMGVAAHMGGQMSGSCMGMWQDACMPCTSHGAMARISHDNTCSAFVQPSFDGPQPLPPPPPVRAPGPGLGDPPPQSRPSPPHPCCGP